MKNIFENPYRIIGVVANASEKDLQQRKSKIQAFARIGKAIDSEFDFSFLPAIERSSEQIERAFASIEQAQDKVNHALFWFINATPTDAVALGHLKNGDAKKAYGIWINIVGGKTITAKNFSAFANLSTLCLNFTDPYKFSGFALKTQLVESEAFTDFIHLVADQTVTIDTQKQLEWLIEQFLITLKSNDNKLMFFSTCSRQVQQLVAKRLTQEPIHLVETEVAKAEKGRKDTPRNAYQIGKSLFAATKTPLSELQKILGNNDLNYKRLSDSVAKTLTQCSIDYVNALQETADPFDQGLELLKWAETLAVNSLTKERIAETKKTLAEMKDIEISIAINVLRSIKTAFDKNEAEINNEVIAHFGYRTYNIDWSKVNKIIHDSINWNKAVEVVKEAIPYSNVNKIRNHNDTQKINEYKNLVEFLLSNLSYSQKNQVSYLKYWTTSSTQRTSSSSYINTSSSSSRSESSELSEGCLHFTIMIVIVLSLVYMCSNTTIKESRTESTNYYNNNKDYIPYNSNSSTNSSSYNSLSDLEEGKEASNPSYYNNEGDNKQKEDDNNEKNYYIDETF